MRPRIGNQNEPLGNNQQGKGCIPRKYIDCQSTLRTENRGKVLATYGMTNYIGSYATINRFLRPRYMKKAQRRPFKGNLCNAMQEGLCQNISQLMKCTLIVQF